MRWLRACAAAAPTAAPRPATPRQVGVPKYYLVYTGWHAIAYDDWFLLYGAHEVFGRTNLTGMQDGLLDMITLSPLRSPLSSGLGTVRHAVVRFVAEGAQARIMLGPRESDLQLQWWTVSAAAWTAGMHVHLCH